MSLADTIAATNKFYKGSIEAMDLDNPGENESIRFRWSGCLAIDWVWGNHNEKGGMPRGAIVEVYGSENAGKTSLCSILTRSTQSYKSGNEVLYVDYEHKYNTLYAEELGISLKKPEFYFVRPKGKTPGEAGMELMAQAVADRDCGLVVVDSIIAARSKEDVSGELIDANIGATARMQTRGIKGAAEALQPDGPTVVIINQTRAQIGGMGAGDVTAGAKALRFFAIIRTKVSVVEKLKDKKERVIGQKVKFTVIKNQASRNFLEEDIDFYFSSGYDNIKWLIAKAGEMEVIKANGNHTKYVMPSGDTYKHSEVVEFLSKSKNLKEIYSLCVKKNNEELLAAKIERELASGQKRVSKAQERLKEKDSLTESQPEKKKD